MARALVSWGFRMRKLVPLWQPGKRTTARQVRPHPLEASWGGWQKVKRPQPVASAVPWQDEVRQPLLADSQRETHLRAVEAASTDLSGDAVPKVAAWAGWQTEMHRERKASAGR